MSILSARPMPPVPRRPAPPRAPADDKPAESGEAGLAADASAEVDSDRPLGGAASASPAVAAAAAGGEGSSAAGPEGEPFHPLECETFKATGLPDALIEGLVLKHLLAVGNNTGRGMCRDLCLPGKSMLALLADLKARQFVVHKGSASMGDFDYTLTDAGRERARGFLHENTYCGPAPVPLKDYVAAVAAQSITREHPGPERLREAFADLLINRAMFDALGPAVNSGRGLFLYGSPGNGKTSIAERITGCFRMDIWIPRAIFVEGDIIQLFDPQCHEPAESGSLSAADERTGQRPVPHSQPSVVKGQAADSRWIRIRRPTIVVGGELTMDALELRLNRTTRITEPSIQLKSNGGTLVIDDFGRQRMNPVELLNRWIVPLEKRYDYLTLSNGKKIQVPFDQLIIFSTNLEPKELVDDAFLRRIPYKINVHDPNEQEFRELMRMMARVLGIEHDEAAVDHLIEHHYKAAGRPLRCCHPRDLILQIINRAKYRKERPVMSTQGFDAACAHYFTVL